MSISARTTSVHGGPYTKSSTTQRSFAPVEPLERAGTAARSESSSPGRSAAAAVAHAASAARVTRAVAAWRGRHSAADAAATADAWSRVAHDAAAPPAPEGGSSSDSDTNRWRVGQGGSISEARAEGRRGRAPRWRSAGRGPQVAATSSGGGDRSRRGDRSRALEHVPSPNDKTTLTGAKTAKRGLCGYVPRHRHGVQEPPTREKFSHFLIFSH